MPAKLCFEFSRYNADIMQIQCRYTVELPLKNDDYICIKKKMADYFALRDIEVSLSPGPSGLYSGEVGSGRQQPVVDDDAPTLILRIAT